MSYHPVPDSRIRDKALVVLDVSNDATKKNQKMLQALMLQIQLVENILLLLKAKVGKLDINKLTNVSTSLNSLKTKVDDLDVGN